MWQKILNWFKGEAEGLLRHVPDVRDLHFKELLLGEYKRKYDEKILAPIFIENQFSLNVCWAEAWANALSIYFGEQVSVKWPVSVAWQKGWSSKNGAQLKVAGDVARKRLIGTTYGVKLESELPSYEENGWDEITNADITRVASRAIESYYFCDTPSDIMQAIDEGYPVVIGRYWTNKFDDGMVLNANRNSNSAHATVIIGYKGQNFVEANSWGKDWGNKGLFYTPMSQIQGDINTFGAIDITKVPYTPKQTKIKGLLEQLKLLQQKIKDMLNASTILYGTAKGLIGENLAKGYQPLGCAVSMAYVVNKAFQEENNWIGTDDVYNSLISNPKWEKVTAPDMGCLGVVRSSKVPADSPLPIINGRKHGHTWILGQYVSPDGSVYAMSNDSDKEIWNTQWTLQKITDYFVTYGKCEVHWFKRIII